MRTVGVRDLRKNISQILKDVSDGGDEVSITSYGKEIARIVPPRQKKTPEEVTRLWQRIDRIAEDVGRYSSQGLSAIDAVREGRE